jgi:hypothetical protein
MHSWFRYLMRPDFHFEGVFPRLLNTMFAAQNREREQLRAELVRVRGLMPLLMKSRSGGRWTDTERKTLQQQLRALAHLSPYLVAMLLPGSFALLPVLAWWLDRRRKAEGPERVGPAR